MKFLIPLLLVQLCFSACFSMGMPEHFAVVDSSHERPTKLRKSALLVLPDSLARGPNAPHQSLGSQFVLGVIPVTRLYFQHSAESLLVESALSVLKMHGYAPLVVRERNRVAVTQLIDPAISMRVDLSDVSVQTFDLFFLRRLGVSGNLQVDFYSRARPQDRHPIRRVESEFGDSQFRSYGHAPALSKLFIDSLVAALQKSISEYVGSAVGGGRSGRGQSLTTVKDPLVFLTGPRFLVRPSTKLGKLFRRSYGFGDLPVIGEGQLSRIVQRGLESGLEESDLEVVSLTDPLQSVGGFRGALSQWRLETEIRSLQLDESQGELSLQLEFRLRDSSSQGTELLSAICGGVLPRSRRDDGYWVVALERASEMFVKDFFSLQSGAAKPSSCRVVAALG